MSLQLRLLLAAFLLLRGGNSLAQDGGGGGGSDGNEHDSGGESEHENENETEENNEGPGVGSSYDAARSDGSRESSWESREGDSAETSIDHPLGDYGAAFLEFAKQLANDLEQHGVSQAGDLLEILREAQFATALWESLKGGGALPYELSGATNYLSDGSAQTYSALLQDFQRIEMFGWAFGWTTVSSTTGGLHNGAPGTNPHAKGTAVDWDVRTNSPAQIEQFMFLARSAGVFVRDELGHPIGQQQWSNPHLHMQSGFPQGKDLGKWSEPGTWKSGADMELPRDGSGFEQGTFMLWRR